MVSGMCFHFDARHHIFADSPVLGAILVLPLARVSRLKLEKQSATTVLQSCACGLAHLSTDLFSKVKSARITTLGLPPASSQLAGSKMVLDGYSAVPKSEAAKL